MPQADAAPRFDVLLVEDNPDHAELILDALAEVPPPTSLSHVASAEAALQRLGALAAADALPNLILLDLNMPGMGGLALLRRLKDSETLRPLPVVVLSTSIEPEDVRAALQGHANSYTRKSADIDELEATLAAIKRYWWQIHILAHARGAGKPLP
ncbi:MAG: response regulator [Pseudomonadota bacterium]